MISKFKTTFLFLAQLVIISACSSTASDNVKTSGLYASFSVDGNSVSTATCNATIRVGGALGTYVDLSSEDVLTCDGVAMNKSNFLGIISYSVSVTYELGKTYTITLTRSGESPYTSTVTLPNPVVVTSPSSGASFQKGSTILTQWIAPTSSSSGAMVTLAASSAGHSYSRSYGSQSDSGSYTFSQTDSTPSEDPGGGWSGSLSVKRYLYGSIASGLDGTASGTQTASVTITFTD